MFLRRSLASLSRILFSLSVGVFPPPPPYQEAGYATVDKCCEEYKRNVNTWCMYLCIFTAKVYLVKDLNGKESYEYLECEKLNLRKSILFLLQLITKFHIWPM